MKTQILRHMEDIIADLESGIASGQKFIGEIDSQVVEIKKNNAQLTGDVLEYQRLELEHKTKDNYTLYRPRRKRRASAMKRIAPGLPASVASLPTVPVKPWFRGWV